MKTVKHPVLLLFFQPSGNLWFFKKSPEKGSTYRTFQQKFIKYKSSFDLEQLEKELDCNVFLSGRLS
jgi:hypothetical protein